MQFQLDELKGICERFICNNIAEYSVLDVLILGDKHHSKILKDTSLIHISENSHEVLQSPDWKMFSTQNVDLLREVCEMFAFKTHDGRQN